MLTDNLNSPLVQSIINGAEERILNMTGFSVRLVIEPQYAEKEYLPKLAKEVTNIWEIPTNTLSLKLRLREVVTYRQIFCLIARASHNKSTLKNIASYLNCDHTTVLHTIDVAKNLLEVKDSYFMTFYEPVKHLLYGTNS